MPHVIQPENINYFFYGKLSFVKTKPLKLAEMGERNFVLYRN